jgi:hypothetical protein
MNRDRIADALFKVGIILVPTAFFLGLYGFLTTPPGEGEVYWWHISGNDKYDQYFDETKLHPFDYEHWHHDWVFGHNIQILAAFLLLVGGILTLTMYRDDRNRAASPVTEEETRSWSLPPPEPRRQRRKRKYPLVSRRLIFAACALVVVLVVVVVVVPPVLQTYASGPKRSAVISVTIEDNEMWIWEGEFWVYVDDEEEAGGILTGNPQDGSGQTTVNIAVTWHGDSIHLCSVSCWYDGRMHTIETSIADQQTTLVRFDVSFY